MIDVLHDGGTGADVKTMRRLGAVVLAATLLLAVAGCASGQGGLASGADTEPEASASPSASAGGPLLTTAHPVTVIGRGEAVELCLGGELQSLPPGCAGGVTLVGWEWEAVAGHYEESAGVRWGAFVVTGTYDPLEETLTPTAVTPRAFEVSPDVDPMGPALGTRCPAPAGGWRIRDESLATQEALHATTAVAATLDGHAAIWLDRTLIPMPPEDVDALGELDHYAVHAGSYILNVAVHGDVAAAERVLRQTWGGALCVFGVDHTQAELDARLQEVMDMGHPWVGAHADGMTGVVSLTVVFDVGGAIQREVDEEHGPGRVRILSALEPVAG